MQTFENEQQLEKYLQIVLKIRKQQLKEENIEKSEHEIFTILKEKWKDENNLHLYKMVDDILNRNLEIEVKE